MSSVEARPALRGWTAAALPRAASCTASSTPTHAAPCVLIVAVYEFPNELANDASIRNPMLCNSESDAIWAQEGSTSGEQGRDGTTRARMLST